MQANSVQVQETHVPLPLRSHTILGVCEGLAEDFGFNPIFLRVPLAALVLWSPLMAVGIYFGLGAIVLASRLIFPRPKAAGAPVAAAQSDNDDRELSIAA
ncbi:MAG TPA: PspC domain-containing protein [Sphingomicrobium sp.]|jgi:phage shock protein C|nr:PspC domain-containing protein [Sphingomicrobium sp.]